ncbi:hypothetical protein [Sphingomonas oryzagri]
MRNSNGWGLTVLALVVALIVIVGVTMMVINRQPKVTPAGPTGSMQGQLSPRTNPPH